MFVGFAKIQVGICVGSRGECLLGVAVFLLVDLLANLVYSFSILNGPNMQEFPLGPVSG